MEVKIKKEKLEEEIKLNDEEEMEAFIMAALPSILDEKVTKDLNDPVFIETEIQTLRWAIKFLRKMLYQAYLSHLPQEDIDFLKDQIRIQKKRIKKRQKQLKKAA